MTMTISRLRTHWSAEEAHTVIEFIDALRDALLEDYGDDIAGMLREAQGKTMDPPDDIEF